MSPIKRNPLPKCGRRLLADFLRARRGLAAVEFALILPFMMVMYLGTFEIVQALSVKRQVTLAASTLANIITQYPSLTRASDWPTIYTAAGTVLTPYSTANAGVTVSVVTINSPGKATVTWSLPGYNGTARVKGSPLTVPTTLGSANTELVLGEVTYKYQPIIDFLHIGTINMYSSVYMLPRGTTGQILCPDC